MTRRALRGAFIGFGNVAANGHMPGWRTRDEITIVAAFDAAAARREAFLAACPEGRWYDSVDQLFAAETLDFVDICTPPGSHALLIERALEAGLHVLCEKPLVTQVRDAHAVAATAAGAGRTLHTIHNWLEAPICRKISALIGEGAIGTVRSIEWHTRRTRPAAAAANGGSNWRIDPAAAGGGILFDHGWHALYCVMHWAGSAPRAVSASLETRRFREWPLEDTATLDLELAGTTAHIFLTWTADERSNHIELIGDEGRIQVIGDCVVAEGGAGKRQWNCPPALSEGSHHPDWFEGVAAQFCGATTGAVASNLREAVNCSVLIDLAQRSSASGGVRLALDALI